MNKNEALLKSIFGEELKKSTNSEYESLWTPFDILRFDKETLSLIYEVVVHTSDYDHSDGSTAYYATITFIEPGYFANFKLDRRVRAEDGDRIDPKSMYLCRLRHKETGAELTKRRLYGKIIKQYLNNNKKEEAY